MQLKYKVHGISIVKKPVEVDYNGQKLMAEVSVVELELTCEGQGSIAVRGTTSEFDGLKAGDEVDVTLSWTKE